MIFGILRQVINKIEPYFYNANNIENYFIKKGYMVGRGNRIGIKKLAGEPYLVRVGNHCTITKGVQLITHDGGCWVFRPEEPDLNAFGKIEIKDNCFVGFRSIILPNVTIGPNSVVGAGSVVTKNVPPNTVVAGVPAKVICTLEEYRKKCYKRWNEVNLQGSKNTWEMQLKTYFWNKKTRST